MDDKSFFRIPKKWVRTGLVVAVTALIVAPLTAVASHSFNDVPDSNTFHDDIAWLADAGVTRGCNPPDNTEFCPADEVTREQMAAFMRRFAQYLDAEDGTPAQADRATTADNADTLDGMTASEFVNRAQIVRVTDNAAVSGQEGFLEVHCPEIDDIAISGESTAFEAGTGVVDDTGLYLKTSTGSTRLSADFPNGWVVLYDKASDSTVGDDWQINASVVCLDI